MDIVIVFLVLIALASVIAALFSRQPRKSRRLMRAFSNVDPMLNRCGNPTPGPREAMENLNREIKATRRRAYRSSHRPRPR